MRAIVITKPGGAEVLQIQELPEPVVTDGEVLIPVRAFAFEEIADAHRVMEAKPPASWSYWDPKMAPGTTPGTDRRAPQRAPIADAAFRKLRDHYALRAGELQDRRHCDDDAKFS